jgi:hypothetical protein
MDRKNVWIVAGAILLGTALLSLSQASAQRNFRTEPGSAESRPARYQVVNVTESEIIIMDVTTGDLYSAKSRDVKPYEARPQSGHFERPDRFGFKEKDGVFQDKKGGFPGKDKGKQIEPPLTDKGFKERAFKEKE